MAPSLPLCFVEEASLLLRRRTGLVIGASRRAAFEAALAEAMRSARVRDPVVYLADLAAAPALMDDLAGRITVGETYFFREPEQCTAIEGKILPALLASRPPEGVVRVWSAGCATGEEPYTLAVIAARLGAARRVRILGTDISRAALARARRAQYTSWSLRGVPRQVVEGCFTRVGDQYQLHAALRGAVEFGYLNLADDAFPRAPSRGFDLILCRNVLIYFDRETIARVAARLMDALADDGTLVLGPSDPMIGEFVPCVVVVSGGGFQYRHVGWRPAPTATRALPAPPQVLEPAPAARERAGPLATTAAAAAVVPRGERASRCYAERDYQRAAELAREAVAEDDADPAAWAILVRALTNLGELGDAERCCAASLDRHATSAELQCLHAMLLNEARQYDAGAVAARRALYLDRELVVAHLALGASQAGLGDAAGARRAFGTVVRLLASQPREEVVPASDGERVANLAALARAELELLEGMAA